MTKLYTLYTVENSVIISEGSPSTIEEVLELIDKNIDIVTSDIPFARTLSGKKRKSSYVMAGETTDEVIAKAAALDLNTFYMVR